MDLHCSSNLNIHFLNLIGEGSNSRVYRGFRVIPGSDERQALAIKVLKSHNQVEQFGNEINNLLKIRSSYCVSLYGWDYVQGQPALIMEYVEGCTLAEIGDELDRSLVEEVVSQIRQALDELAQFEVCHGDLNLQNVMVDTTGHVRLLDFGTHKSKIRMATPEFASSRVLAGEEPDYGTDMVSLSLIYKFLLRGRGEKLKGLADLTSQPSCRERLAEIVWAHVASRQNTPNKTVLLDQNVPLLFHPLAVLASAILVLFLFFGDSQKTYADKVRLLKIKVPFWVHLRLDGQDLGYAPLDIMLKAEGHHALEWESPYGSGIIHIDENVILPETLNDRFFKPKLPD